MNGLQTEKNNKLAEFIENIGFKASLWNSEWLPSQYELNFYTKYT